MIFKNTEVIILPWGSHLVSKSFDFSCSAGLYGTDHTQVINGNSEIMYLYIFEYVKSVPDIYFRIGAKLYVSIKG